MSLCGLVKQTRLANLTWPRHELYLCFTQTLITQNDNKISNKPSPLSCIACDPLFQLRILASLQFRHIEAQLDARLCFPPFGQQISICNMSLATRYRSRISYVLITCDFARFFLFNAERVPYGSVYLGSARLWLYYHS